MTASILVCEYSKHAMTCVLRPEGVLWLLACVVVAIASLIDSIARSIYRRTRR